MPIDSQGANSADDQAPTAGSETIYAPESGPESEGAVIGRYRLLEKIGEGGFGVVYVAEQKEPVKRRVALKIIKLGMDTRQVVARFEAERQALALMDHPNIARVFDAGATETGRPFFVMELVRGVPITKYCDDNRLATEERLQLFIHVCGAIQHAHQKGIIHRDIKPSNVLVTMNDGEALPKVIDFGIAKATQSELTEKTIYTQFEQFIGTPAYMSPEQAEMSSQDVDTRSDIYSLGVLLYELLVGKTPFDGKELLNSGLEAMRRTIREKEPVRPSTRLQSMGAEELTSAAQRRSADAPKLVRFVRGDLDWIVLKCLEKDRRRRYETANGLALDLKRHLNNEPVLVRPPSTAYRLQKFYRRNKVGAIAGAFVVVALLAGISLAMLGFAHERRAHRLAEARRVDAENARKAEAEQRERLEQARRDEAVERRRAEANELQARRLLYASDMNLAYQALQMNNLGRARRLLDRSRPAPGAEDLRGWEWRYLWQQCQSDALAVLKKHSARGMSVSFSTDGRRLAVGYLDGLVELWDVNRRSVQRVLVNEKNGASGRVEFAPAGDRLAFSAGVGKLLLYDFAAGTEKTLWNDTRGAVRELSFSRDGKHLAAFLSPSRAVVFDCETGEIETSHQSVGQSLHYGSVAISPDGRRLFFSKSDFAQGRAMILAVDLASDKILWEIEGAQDYGVSALAISPDGKLLASGAAYEDSRIRLWDTQTGTLVRNLTGHSGWVGRLAFSPDGRSLASAAADQSLRLWNVAEGRELAVFRGHGDEVHAVAFSADGKLLASGAKDGEIMLWDVAARDASSSYRHFDRDLAGVMEVQPGVLLEIGLTNGQPGSVTALSLVENSTREFAPFRPRGSVMRLAAGTFVDLSEDGGEVVEATAEGLRGLNVKLGGETALATRKGDWIAWSSRGSSICHLVALTNASLVRQIETGLSNAIPMAIAPEGRYVAVAAPVAASEIGIVRRGGRVIETATGRVVIQTEIGDLYQPQFANEGKNFVAVDFRRDISVTHLWKLADPAHPAAFSERGAVSSLAVSPDGRTLALSSEDGYVVLYDLETLERRHVLRGHMQGVHSVVFSPDGRRLLTSSGAIEALKIWDLATHQELLTLPGKGTVLNRASFIDHGNAILVGGQSPRSWQLWRAPSWETIAKHENSRP